MDELIKNVKCCLRLIQIFRFNYVVISFFFRKLRQLAESQTIVTNTIICTVCGGTGHIAQDCKQKRWVPLANLVEENHIIFE